MCKEGAHRAAGSTRAAARAACRGSAHQQVDASFNTSEVGRQLQGCFRLQALPAMPLQQVAREAGLSARLVSKQLLEAYGQLRCGLRLECYTPAELLHILQQQCGRLGGITALELAHILDEEHALLSYSGWVQQDQQRQLKDVVASIPAAFNTLQSLDLCGESTRVLYADASEALLAPLRSCLTSLKLRTPDWHPVDQPAVPPAFRQLACLRHLTVDMPDTISKEQVTQWLEALASLPALVQLHLRSPLHPHNAELWLPGLSQSTPQLTSLALELACDWDSAALSALQRGLPGLKSLSLSLRDDCREAASVLPGVLPALACRSGLTSLSLECALSAPELQQPVPASLQLAAWTLDLGGVDGRQTGRWLLEALPFQTALTRLTVRLPWPPVGAAAVLRSNLLAMPCTLVRLELACGYPGFDAGSFMEGVSRQRGLTELRLTSWDMRRWAQEAADKLAAMTQLRRLRLQLGMRFASGFYNCLAGLTQLRQLELCGGPGGGGVLTDAMLQFLHPLQQLARFKLYSASCDDGPGLTVLRQLGALEELDVTLAAVAVGRLQRWLLPLPLTLRKLVVSASDADAWGCRVDDSLLAAAKSRGCAVACHSGRSRRLLVR